MTQSHHHTWAELFVGRVVVGRYRLHRLIGAGGMGAVFEATQLALGRKLAVKVLVPELAAEKDFVQRFQREAILASSIDQSVVQVIDFDVDEEVGPIMVMELLEGESLGGRLARKRRLDAPEVARVASAMLDTLGAVHARGIVHRDIKPQNVFCCVSPVGEVSYKLLDFGVARVAGKLTVGTVSGVVVGTPCYMPPEQARGEKEVGPTADLYSMGALAYACLAGRPPYSHLAPDRILSAVQTQAPKPLRQFRPDLPDELYLWVERAMAREPEDRFPTAALMKQELMGIGELAHVPRTISVPVLAPASEIPTEFPEWGKSAEPTAPLAGVAESSQVGNEASLTPAPPSAATPIGTRFPTPAERPPQAPVSAPTMDAPSPPPAPSEGSEKGRLSSPSEVEERRVGPFRLVRPLGHGGFAPVWLAREVYGDTELRTVALKLFSLAGAGASEPGGRKLSEASTRIVEEARSLCRVEHPNIVRFLTITMDESQGLIGIAMEYLPGKSLATRLKERGTLSISDVLDVGIAAASALAAVHRAGLLHRDVKPDNFVETEGHYKLIDFGIASAKLVGEDRESQSEVVAGAGTPGYMDPACVARRDAATASSDLYALGATLYECLVGHVPAAKDAATREQLLHDVLVGTQSAPSLVGARADLPAALAELVDSLLAVDPEARPRSAEHVAQRLERIRGGLLDPVFDTTMARGPSATAPGTAAVAFRDDSTGGSVMSAPTSRLRLLWAVAGLGVLGAAGGAILWRTSAPHPAHSASATSTVSATAPPFAHVVPTASHDPFGITYIGTTASAEAYSGDPRLVATWPTAQVEAIARGTKHLPNFYVIHAAVAAVQTDRPTTFAEAAARCRKAQYTLCTSVQWDAICESRNPYSRLRSWTFDVSPGGKPIIRGGEGDCRARTEATDPAMVSDAACCSLSTEFDGDYSFAVRAHNFVAAIEIVAIMKGNSFALGAYFTAPVDVLDKRGLRTEDVGPLFSELAARDSYFRMSSCVVGKDKLSAQCNRVQWDQGKLSVIPTRVALDAKTGLMRAFANTPAAK
jgi:serine/threonine protein kinase